jgi:uncharacterized protein (DUF433 family)
MIAYYPQIPKLPNISIRLRSHNAYHISYNHQTIAQYQLIREKCYAHYYSSIQLVIHKFILNVTMDWQARITLNPNILVGKPIIKGTRLAVEFIIDLLAQGWSIDEILRNYPGITVMDIQACLCYASASLKSEKVYAINA